MKGSRDGSTASCIVPLREYCGALMTMEVRLQGRGKETAPWASMSTGRLHHAACKLPAKPPSRPTAMRSLAGVEVIRSYQPVEPEAGAGT